MANLPARLLALGAASGLALALSGCASPGPMMSRHGTIGNLKTSLAQLETDNQNLKREVAQLKADNTRIEDDLVQAEAARGELAARLDDAKELITRQGGDTTALGRGKKGTADDEIPPPVRTINRSSRRPPPAASIPRPRAADPDDNVLDPGPSPSANRRSRDVGPQSRLDDGDGRWLPVARGRSAASARLR